MKILFIGDSITRGTVGVNYVKRLARENPKWIVENAGVNGETLTKIGARLRAKLIPDAHYDVIVLQAGYNDILLPSFAQKGYLFRKAHDHLIKKEYKPLATAAEFEQAYRQIIEYCLSHSQAKLILTTIGCLNENHRFELNKKRQSYNQLIRSLAREYDCYLADPATMIDQVLSQLETRDYCLQNFFNTSWFDLWQCAYLGRADHLSKNRKLHLTVDGVHLNTSGAQIFKDEIEKHLTDLYSSHFQKQAN